MLTLLLLEKLTLSFVTIHFNAGHTYELVKEVTLINHSNNGFAVLLLSFLPRRYTERINPFSSDMHISPTIHYNAGHSYKINSGADEMVA